LEIGTQTILGVQETIQALLTATDPSQTEFIDKQLLFTDHDFQMLAITAFYEWNPIDAESDEFTAKDC
jgi:hypothetical protein